MREHLLFNNAQLGAGHELSKRSTAVVEKAHEVIKVTCHMLTKCPQLPDVDANHLRLRYVKRNAMQMSFIYITVPILLDAAHDLAARRTAA